MNVTIRGSSADELLKVIEELYKASRYVAVPGQDVGEQQDAGFDIEDWYRFVDHSDKVASTRHGLTRISTMAMNLESGCDGMSYADVLEGLLNIIQSVEDMMRWLGVTSDDLRELGE